MKDKHKYGQYFTEPAVAEFMVSLISHTHNSRILEPSCGEGVFLTKLIPDNFSNISAYEIDKNLATNFAFVKHQSFLSVPLSEKYDVIIGNPPYIRWKNLEPELKDELANNALWNRYFNSLCDYLFIFILKSIEHLNEGGELIFICSDYWMNTTHSVSLRNYMSISGFFEKIYHFKEAPLFENVTASFVIFKYIKTAKAEHKNIELFEYNQKGKPSLAELKNHTCFNKLSIPQFEYDKRWILADETTQHALEVFEESCIKQRGLLNNILYRVGDICNIANGMVSGLDAAFAINQEDVDLLNDEEKKCLIHVLKAKNLAQYRFVKSSFYIYLHTGLEMEDFVRIYPNFVVHFQPFIQKLKDRYQYGRELPYWEFAFPRSKGLFDQAVPKIFIPCKERISHKNYFRFCYAPIGFYPLQDVTGIIPKSNCRESIEYLLAYLNTDYVFQWLKYNGIVKGEIVEFSETPIANIPYMPIDWNNSEEIILHEKITKEVKDLLEAGSNQHIQHINHLFNTLFYVKSKLYSTNQRDERFFRSEA